MAPISILGPIPQPPYTKAQRTGQPGNSIDYTRNRYGGPSPLQRAVMRRPKTVPTFGIPENSDRPFRLLGAAVGRESQREAADCRSRIYWPQLTAGVIMSRLPLFGCRLDGYNS
jgi:hypothetical protein